MSYLNFPPGESSTPYIVSPTPTISSSRVSRNKSNKSTRRNRSSSVYSVSPASSPSAQSTPRLPPLPIDTVWPLRPPPPSTTGFDFIPIASPSSPIRSQTPGTQAPNAPSSAPREGFYFAQPFGSAHPSFHDPSPLRRHPVNHNNGQYGTSLAQEPGGAPEARAPALPGNVDNQPTVTSMLADLTAASHSQRFHMPTNADSNAPVRHSFMPPPTPPPDLEAGHDGYFARSIRCGESAGSVGGRAKRDPIAHRSLDTHLWPWLPEILALVISMVAFGAVVVCLSHFNGQSLRTWPLSITLNSLIGFMTTLSIWMLVVAVTGTLGQLKWNWFASRPRHLRDFETFDSAGRTPWGVLYLMGRGKGWVMGFVAGLILIMTLFATALTQSAIQYPTKARVANFGGARVSRSESYGSGNTATIDDLSPVEKQATSYGLLHPPESSMAPLAPSCTTGTCRYPAISSLAICSATADVSSQFSVSSASSLGWTSDSETLSASWDYMAILPNGVHLTSFNGSFNLNISSPPSPSELVSSIVQTPLSADTSSVSPAHGTLAFKDNPTLSQTAIANYFLVYTNQTGPTPTFRAMEVLLHFCVNTYSVTIDDGVPSSTVNRTVTKIAGGSSTKDPNSGIITLEGSDGATFTVNKTHLHRLQSHTRHVLAGSYSAAGSAANNPTLASEAYGSALFKAPSFGSPVEVARDDSRIIEAISGNIATSLTNALRSIGPTVEGQTLANETVVEIHWAWLTVLTAQIALAVLFLASVMVQTASMRVRVVKNSALATMLAIPAAHRAALEADMVARRNEYGLATRFPLREKGRGGLMGSFVPVAGQGWVMSLWNSSRQPQGQ